MHRHHDEPHAFAFESATPHYAADRPVAATHVKLEVDLDFPAQSLTGRCSTTVKAVREVRDLTFDAVALTVSQVLVDQHPVEFDLDGAQLRVLLNKPLAAGASCTVTVAYSCTPQRGLYFLEPDRAYPRRPRQAWTQGQDEDSRFWFPCLDTPAQKATTEVIATFPKAMTALSNGALLTNRTAGARRTMHFRLDAPHSPYLVTLVVGQFETHLARTGKTAVRTLFPKGAKADALRCVERTPRMVAFFEGFTGQSYPWGDYAQVFVGDFIFGGMENTGATTLSDAVLHDARAHLDYSAEPLISHELAHQWFGDLLTCRDWPHGWLNEGFATYLEVLWAEHAEGPDEADHQRKVDLDAYLAEAGERYARPIVERKFDAAIELFDRHLYEKGGLVLHALRRALGDDDFHLAVRHYVAAHRGGAVETIDLARAVEAATGRNFDRFFDQWVHRAGHPALTVEARYDAGKKQVRLAVKQTQGGEPYHLPLEVTVVADGETHSQLFTLDRADAVFTLHAAREPKQCVVDGRRDLLATLKVDKPVGWWRTELRHGFCARARAEAAAALGKDGSAPSVLALGEGLADETEFWATRAACARALGAIRTPAASKHLLSSLAIKHPKARRAVVAALGLWRHDAEVGEALTRLCRAGDASYYVEAEAARSLGKVRAKNALAVLTAMLERPSFQDVIACAAYDALAELKEPAGWKLALAGARYGNAPHARRAAVHALARLAEPLGHKADAVEVLTDLLRDPAFRVRLAAIDAAQALGDARLVGPLSTTPFLDGRENRSAREAARTLREKAGPTKELAALRSELDKLTLEVKALKEKVEPPAKKRPARR